MNTTERDAAILREYKTVGDARRLAAKHHVDVAHVLKVIHHASINRQVADANVLAQQVMQTGEVVFALPGNSIQTNAGAQALVQSIQNALRANRGDLKVVVAVAVIPVDEINITQLPIQHEQSAALTLQAKAVNGVRS